MSERRAILRGKKRGEGKGGEGGGGEGGGGGGGGREKDDVQADPIVVSGKAGTDG